MVEIVSFSLRMAKLRSRTIEYENEFWQADSFDRFPSERGAKDVPAARVAQAAVGEYRRSTRGAVRDPEALRGRITTAMDSQIAHETDEIAERLNFLATVGSVAPFVGLFGTVWGIMNSFIGIAEKQTTNLAVVAPGIAEALIATAAGLAAAIPAVYFYNLLTNRVKLYLSAMEDFSLEFLNIEFSRLDLTAARSV